MKRVFLIRHGVPEFPNGEKMCLGTTDIPMAQEGFSQAREMARTLPPVTAVYSSCLTRSVQTAQAIGLPVTRLEGLGEIYAGEWDGLTFRQIRQRYPELYAARGVDPKLPMPGAEEPQQALARFCTALEEAARQSPGDLAVVSHGGILSRFLESIGAEPIKPHYGQVIPVWYDGHRFFL